MLLGDVAGSRREDAGGDIKKLGIAWADFLTFERLWKHTAISKDRKIEIGQATVTSRLLYGLSGAWINVAERRRLDGFESRCLRNIVRIPPAYVSRTSNQDILEVAKQKPYTKQLLLQHLKLFGKVASAPDTDPLHALTFSPGSFCTAGDGFVWKAGRPRNEWAGQLQSVALKVMAVCNLIRVPAA